MQWVFPPMGLPAAHFSRHLRNSQALTLALLGERHPEGLHHCRLLLYWTKAAKKGVFRGKFFGFHDLIPPATVAPAVAKIKTVLRRTRRRMGKGRRTPISMMTIST